MEMYKPVIRWWSLVDTRLIAHFTETLEVGTDRFVFRKGVLGKKESVIPFSRITNYSDSQTLFDRVFKVGNFTVETAGSIAPELVLRGYPLELREILSTAVNTQ